MISLKSVTKGTIWWKEEIKQFRCFKTVLFPGMTSVWPKQPNRQPKWQLISTDWSLFTVINTVRAKYS